MHFLKLTDTKDKKKYINMDLVCQIKSDDKGSIVFFIASDAKGLEFTRVQESGHQIMALMGEPINP